MTFVHWLQKILCITLFGLIILGAGVRLANAGLACPDWPFCFGQIIPDFNFQIFMEWIHRVIAMCTGIMALVIAIVVWSKAELRSKLGWLAFFSLLLFGVQAFLGRQTVLLFLKSETVTAHLMGGYSLLALNILILDYWRPRLASQSGGPRWPLILALIITFFQATLGGTVSSHYAGLACPDFPTCLGYWWPPLHGPVAFHFFHRLGAYTLLLVSLIAYWKLRRTAFQKWATLGAFFVSLQIIWGILMIYQSIHPFLSLLHSATALSIFTTYLLGSLRAIRP